ncbi:MAG TPA: winged helix-turn-helix domain-containing protein [Pyrinomonadaceae bacterium]|jgi:serine/threonine-protein kinase
MSKPSDRLYEFGPYRLDAVKRVLLREGEPVPVTSKAFDTLLLLIEHSGQVLQKDELMKALWPDTIVEENNLTQQISMLRKALGERAHEHRYVVTVPGRGYSFVAQVRETAFNETEPGLDEQHRSEAVTNREVEEGRETAKGEERADRPRVVTSAAAAAHPRRWNSSLTLVALFALLFTLGLASSYHWMDSKARGGETPAYGRSIAVLPFNDLSTRSSDNSLGLGITDTLIARLSNIREISVRPTSAVLKYADAEREALSAGRELGVDSVLEGTVQRSGDTVRVTVQLIGVRDGKPFWAQSFDERLTDVFAMQDSISEQIARAMVQQLNVR